MIRKAKRKDLEKILELNNEQDALIDQDIDFFKQFLNKDLYVYEKKGQIKGVLNAVNGEVGYENDGYIWARRRFKKFCYIDRVMVDKNSRRQGIATALFQNMIDKYLRPKGRSISQKLTEQAIHPSPKDKGILAIFDKKRNEAIVAITSKVPKNKKAINFLKYMGFEKRGIIAYSRDDQYSVYILKQ